MLFLFSAVNSQGAVIGPLICIHSAFCLCQQFLGLVMAIFLPYRSDCHSQILLPQFFFQQCHCITESFFFHTSSQHQQFITADTTRHIPPGEGSVNCPFPVSLLQKSIHRYYHRPHWHFFQKHRCAVHSRHFLYIPVLHLKPHPVKRSAFIFSKKFQISLTKVTSCAIAWDFTFLSYYNMLYYIMIRTFGAYRCFATIMIQFAVRQSCKHVGSLALIISYFCVFSMKKIYR